MLNIDLLQALLIIAIAGGSIMSLLIQKIKESINIKDSKVIVVISFITNMILGTLFALWFSDVILISALWVGLFSFIGADLIYKVLEDKVFKSFETIKTENITKYEVK